jgi:type I restriction enzyme M protein
MPSHDSQASFFSASLGDLCAFAVENFSMAIRGIGFDFGKEPADTFTRDQHPDLRADFVMANPPFNIKEWWDGKLEGDARWSRSEAESASHAKFYKNRGKYGTPPQGNANFAWVQHMLHHLAPNGSMALLLANGSMSSNSSGEGDIRRALIEADLVECMVALPGQLFTNTQIPACIWFLTKNKAKRSRPGAAALRDRRGETLFIDARRLGFMKDRVLRDFTGDDIEKIAGTVREWRFDDLAWRGETEGKGGTLPADPGSQYEDIPGFCKSATVQEIASHGHVLTPGRYVGTEDIEEDGEPFEEKMSCLVAELIGQFAKSGKLEKVIASNLASLGF